MYSKAELQCLTIKLLNACKGNLRRLTPEILEMSIIQKHFGYKDEDLKCSLVYFVTHVTCQYLK